MRALALGPIAMLVLAACGGSSGGGDSVVADLAAPAGSTDDAGAVNALPDVDVVDLATGGEINLRSLIPATEPVVLWFWAPH